MKFTKILSLALVLITLMSCFAYEISASAENSTSEAITESSSLRDDLALLGLDINDYYLNDNAGLTDLYLIAIGESYVDGFVKQYYYLYYPGYKANAFVDLYRIVFDINGYSYNFDVSDSVEYDERGLAKLSGAVLQLQDTIEMKCTGFEGDVVQNGIDVANSHFDSEFTYYAERSYENDVFTNDYNYTSYLVIQNYEVVRVNVDEDEGYFDNWSEFWNASDSSVDLYFYNFDFPDRIAPDFIEYAKFSYLYKQYEKYEYLTEDLYDLYKDQRGEPYDNLLSSTPLVNEYYPGSKNLTLKCGYFNTSTVSVDYDVFYLGNRYSDGQFHFTDDTIVEGDVSAFDRDCSILIDMSYKKVTPQYIGVMGAATIELANITEYSALDEVVLIELCYSVDGDYVQSFVIDTPVDEDDIIDFEVNANMFPDDDFGDLEIILGILIFVVGLVALSYVVPFVKTILSGLIDAISFLIQLLVSLITLPFELLASIFGGDKPGKKRGKRK